MQSRFEFGSVLGNELIEEEPIRLCVLADFAIGAKASLREVEDLDELLEYFLPELALEIRGQELKLSFEEMEDFHPDNLYEKLPIFTDLRALKKRLMNPKTFVAAAQELGVGQNSPSEDGSGLSDLESLLGGKVSGHESEGGLPNALESHLASIVAPYIEADTGADLAACLLIVDTAVSGLMREILHHVDFQALESAWKSLEKLYQAAEAGVEIFALNCSKSNLLDLPELCKGKTWQAIISLHDFSAVDDTQALEQLSSFGNLLSLRVYTHTSAFAMEDEAMSPFLDLKGLSLSVSQFMLRYPYGQKTDEIEAFAFEECAGQTEEYLWAPSSVLYGLAYLAYKQGSTQAHLIGDLPYHVFDFEGQSKQVASLREQFNEADEQLFNKYGIGTPRLVAGRNSVALS